MASGGFQTVWAESWVYFRGSTALAVVLQVQVWWYSIEHSNVRGDSGPLQNPPFNTLLCTAYLLPTVVIVIILNIVNR